MDLKRKIGQMIVAGFEGTSVTEEIRALITKYHVGNIILFDRNCKTPKQVFNLVKDLQSLAMESNGAPLFVTIDQENGMVARLYQGVTHFPGNMAQGAVNNAEDTYNIGKFTGEGLGALGINFNLAPSLDVNNNPKNPVIGVRSFGDDPSMVGELGAKCINGMQDAGIIATAKHFPGHGDTVVDSHIGLAAVPHDKERLNKVELYPFKKAIEAGVKAIMTAHIIFPAFESRELPATLSYNVLTKLLREELGFKGLIITDCMEMKAIDNHFKTEEGVPMAIKAGADLICISHTFEKQVKSIEKILEKIEMGELTEDIIDNRVERILEEKSKLKLTDGLSKEFNDIEKLMDKAEHISLAEKVSQESITVIKNQGIIPLKAKKILVIASKTRVITGAEGFREEISFGRVLKDALVNSDVNYKEIDINLSKVQAEEIAKESKNYEAAVICTINGTTFSSQIDLVKEVLKENEDVLLIPMRNPYDYLELRDVKGCILPYEYTKNSMKSLIKVLKGEVTPVGKSPVRLS